MYSRPLSLTRLTRLGPVDQEAAQVTAGAGVTLRQVADAGPAPIVARLLELPRRAVVIQ